MKKNYIIFSSGDIGALLMYLWLIESIKKIEEYNFYILLSRNSEIYNQLLSQYPQIKIISIKSISNFKSTFKLIFNRNIILTPPNFGPLHPKLIFLANLFSLFGKWLRFDDKNFNKNDLIIHNLIDINKNQIVELKDLNLDDNFKLKYVDCPKISDNDYIVFHPFASNEKRTFPDDRSVQLISKIKKEFPELDIFVSTTNSTLDRAISISEKTDVRILNTNISKIPSILDKAFCTISVDTGNIHIASILKRHCVEMANLSNLTWLPYYSKNTKILFNKNKCFCDNNKGRDCIVKINNYEYYRCMYYIEDNDIINAIKK